MIIAVIAGFAVGIISLLIRDALGGTDNPVWKVIDAIFFQDITQTTKIEGVGIMFIIGQLFMHGLQLAIVPLVLCSLSLALTSLADPKKLGRIAGKTFITYLFLYCRGIPCRTCCIHGQEYGRIQCKSSGSGSDRDSHHGRL